MMIKIQKLTKAFKKHTILDALDLNMNTGERIALIGSNGAGKTTLIRCLLGEYTFTGNIDIKGKAVRENRTELLKNIGFVPQIPPPLKTSVGHLLKFAATVSQTEPERMQQVIEKLGLSYDKIESQPFVKLSGGQKQKVLIAIALGRDTQILMLDEPTASLDPKARKVLFELLAERIDNTLMLISSHRLDEVSGLVNRVIEMDRGKIILDDKVDDDVHLTSVLSCKVILSRAEDAFARSIVHWQFSSDENNTVWSGEIPGPDRLKFLGLLSRYAAILSGVEINEVS